MNTLQEKTGLETSQGDRPLRVLLAEDHKINQKVMAALFSNSNFVLNVVENGVEAISALREGPYDIVLMDIQMPIMDGVTAAKEIRKLPGLTGKIPIIAVTADAVPKRQQEYISAGMQATVAKPVMPKELFAAIERCVGRAKLSDPSEAQLRAQDRNETIAEQHERIFVSEAASKSVSSLLQKIEEFTSED